MANKKNEKEHKNITVGDIKNDSGTINIAGNNIAITTTTNSGLDADAVAKTFKTVYTLIEKRHATPAERADLKAEVQDVQAAIKEPKADESFIVRRLRNIGRMAPDIFDVIIATIASPAAGLGMAGKKIAEKAKEK